MTEKDEERDKNSKKRTKYMVSLDFGDYIHLDTRTASTILMVLGVVLILIELFFKQGETILTVSMRDFGGGMVIVGIIFEIWERVSG